MRIFTKKVKAKIVGISTYVKDKEKDGKSFQYVYKYANVIYSDPNDSNTKGLRASSLSFDDSLPIVVGPDEVTITIVTAYNNNVPQSTIVGVDK